jgi:hypothetical protein
MFPGPTPPFKAAPPNAVPLPFPLQPGGDDLEAVLNAYRSQMSNPGSASTVAAPSLTPLAPEEVSPLSSLSSLHELEDSPQYDPCAERPREEVVAKANVPEDPWGALQRAREEAHASAPWRRRSRSPVREPVLQSAYVPKQPASAPPPHVLATALSAPPTMAVPVPPPPPPPVRPKAKPAPSWEGAYWRAGTQRYGARGGLQNANVQWHSMKAKAKREGWLESFFQTFPKPTPAPAPAQPE